MQTCVLVLDEIAKIEDLKFDEIMSAMMYLKLKTMPEHKRCLLLGIKAPCKYEKVPLLYCH